MTFAIQIVQLLVVPISAPLVVGIIRKLKAFGQNRRGASIFQPYRALWKLFHKDEVVSRDASWIFQYAPYILFGSTIAISASTPIFFTSPASAVGADFLVIIYFIALGTFFLALAGLDAGSAFGGLGSSREMTLTALTEGGLLFSLLVAAMHAGTTNTGRMIEILANMPISEFAPLGIAFIAFFIVLLSENARYPFDNPATHLELTMVHEAMILEYSGKRLALIEWAAANKLLIFLILGGNIFFPWGLAHPLTATGFGIVLAIAVIALKILILGSTVALIESTIPKLRFFRLPNVLFTSFILGVIALIITIL